MKISLRIFSILFILAVASVFIAGCSDTSSPDTSSSQTAAVTTTAAMTAKYAAGDIVKNPKSTVSSGLLILGYDAAADTYERAYIYPNTDGSWGYRLDSKTEKISRSTIETVYSQKAGSVEVSSIPIGKPTTATTVATTVATTSTTATTVATTTTASANAPQVSDITPWHGTTGSTVLITSLSGKNFVSGANVTLSKNGQTTITATSVSVTSPTAITCKFAIPSSAGIGPWNVVVTNPDGQYYTWTNSFTVVQGDTSVTTTTTTSSSTSTRNPESISIISEGNPIRLGQTIYSYKIGFSGTNLSCTTGDLIRLVGSNSHSIDSQSGTYYCSDTRNAFAFFTIPTGYQDTYTVEIVDSNNKIIASLNNALTITTPN